MIKKPITVEANQNLTEWLPPFSRQIIPPPKRAKTPRVSLRKRAPRIWSVGFTLSLLWLLLAAGLPPQSLSASFLLHKRYVERLV